MPRLIAGFLCLLMLIVPQAVARELTDAPEAEIIGFSPDGRYFAYEQYAWDVVSDAVYSAVFVIDRDTNALVPDFPIGLVPEEVEGEFPGRVGGFDPDPQLIDTGDGTPDLLGLRKAVRDEAQVRLDALEIGLGGRRIAGVPITQRGPTPSVAAPLTFALAPTLSSGIPDGQHTYAIEAKFEPDANECFGAAHPARGKTITFDVVASANWPETKEVARGATAFEWPVPADSCVNGLWISDIIAPPLNVDAGVYVVVLFLAGVWSPGADAASWHALFVKLPDGPAQ